LFGAGAEAGVGAILVKSWKNHHQRMVGALEEEPRYQM
jgi:hypothetical protein